VETKQSPQLFAQKSSSPFGSPISPYNSSYLKPVDGSVITPQEFVLTPTRLKEHPQLEEEKDGQAFITPRKHQPTI
jgi:hypothetical protein